MQQFPHYNKICSDLQSENKFQRKQGLQEILKDVESIETWDEQSVMELWEIVHRPLVRTLQDQIEACRDLTIEILKKFILHLPCSDKNIVYIIPILAKRLGPQELIESSEEVRLKCVGLIKVIVMKYQDKLTAYFDDLVTILTRTVCDKYPKVKQESCECICQVAESLPHDFYKRSAAFVNPILNNISHQHHKVRVATVRTIGEVLLYGESKSMENVTGPLAGRLFDQSASVRKAVVEVAGKWMRELNDRYSWWYKILPLLLTGINDVVPEIRQIAITLWINVGEQYITENEQDKKFKEKLDFLSETLPHYPPNIIRPNLGCRTIVQQNLSRLTAAISRELNDWVADIRVRAAQLLCIVVLNVEEEITNYVTKLLPSMYRASNDEDKRVVENVELAAEYMAYFIPSNIFIDTIIPHLQVNPTKGHLKIFAAVIRGSPRKELVPELSKIDELLQESKISQNRKVNYQLSVLNCCQSLLNICKEDCASISQVLFSTIFTVMALSSESLVQENAKELLVILTQMENLVDLNELNDKHIVSILTSIQNEPESWDVYSYEFHVFYACIIHARLATYNNLTLILPIFKKTTLPDGDPKLRLKQYIAISEYFQEWKEPILEENTKAFVDFATDLVENVIIPGLQWTAGRTAEATRTASVCCLCAFLNKLIGNCSNDDKDHKNQSKFSISVEHFGWLFEKVRPVLVSLIEDDSYKTRLYSLQALCLVMNIGQELSYVTEEHIHKLNPEILTRLEDQHDDVRLAAIEAMREIWKVLPKDYDLSFYYVHIEYAYAKMITHLDDPGEKFQKLTFDCLMDLMKIHPESFIEKIQESQVSFINQKALNLLLKAAQDYMKKRNPKLK